MQPCPRFPIFRQTAWEGIQVRAQHGRLWEDIGACIDAGGEGRIESIGRLRVHRRLRNAVAGIPHRLRLHHLSDIAA